MNTNENPSEMPSQMTTENVPVVTAINPVVTDYQQPVVYQVKPLVAAADPNLDHIKLELLKQFEYYFSSKNLLTDNYLLSQMDHEAYVPVSLIAQFKRIKQLTNDYELILETIRSSSQLQLDPMTQSKVRSIGGHQGGLITITSTKKIMGTKPVYLQSTEPLKSSDPVAASNQQQRCVIIMREVASAATLDQIKELFCDKEPACPPADSCESAGNDSWYITFSNEDDAQRALAYLKAEVQVFMEKPIRARIKAHSHAATITRSSTGSVTSNSSPMSPSNNSQAVYPQINRVMNESPSSFISPSASPQLQNNNEQGNTQTANHNSGNTVFLPQYPNQVQQPYMVQPAQVMSPSNYKNHPYMMSYQSGPNDPAMMNQQQQQQYWQLNANPKMINYYGNNQILSPQPQNLNAKAPNDQDTKNITASPKVSHAATTSTTTKPEQEPTSSSGEVHNQSQVQYHPQMVQMQLGYNGQVVAQAAAVQAYYQSLSQSPSQPQQQQPYIQNQQQPSQQPTLLSSSSSSSLSSTPINQQQFPQQQQPQQNGSFLAPPGNYQQPQSTPNNKDNTTTHKEAKEVAAKTNGSVTPSQTVVSPNGQVFGSNPYLITSMNNMSINNQPGNANMNTVAAINAAYQYYHNAYNNQINPNYQQPQQQQQQSNNNGNQQQQQNQGSFQHVPMQVAPHGYFEVIQVPAQSDQSQPESANKSESNKPTESNQAHLVPAHLVYNHPNIHYTPLLPPNNQFNPSGVPSPQLLVTTINGQPQAQHGNGSPSAASQPQYAQHMGNSTHPSQSFAHTPPPQPAQQAMSSIQHFSNNQQRRSNGTSSLTESGNRYHNPHHFQHNYNNNNRSNYRKFNNHMNHQQQQLDNNSYLLNNTSQPASILSPGSQQHHYNNNHGHYNQGHKNSYYNYNNTNNNNPNYTNNNERLANNNSHVGNQQSNQKGGEHVKHNEVTSSAHGETSTGSEDASKMTKSPPINCDLVSFPPLLNAVSTNTSNTQQQILQQQQQPVTTSNPNPSVAGQQHQQAADSLAASATQFDPAIISISNSANSIPNSPTIINTPNSTSGNNSSPKVVNNKKQTNNITKMLASANSIEHQDNMGNVNSPHSQHHPKQYEKSSISRASTGSNPDNNHYTPKQHQSYHNNNYQSYSKSGGAYSSRKSTDGVQHFNNSARGANQGSKFYQGQNGRNNRQNNQHNSNSANSNSSVSASVSTESSAVNSQTSSPSSNSNRNKKGQSAYSTANSNVSHNTNNAGKNAKTIEATNSDDEAHIQNGGGCWGNQKKLTFAEILQKKSAAAAASQQQQNQQQDSSISVSSTNSSSASSSQSSQATTPTTVNPAKSFPLALSGTITNIYGNSSAQSDQFDGKNNELLVTNNANSSIPV